MDIQDVINTGELKERLDGDFDLLKELIEIFIMDSDSLLAKIKEGIDERDPEKLSKASHTLKGAVSNFSAKNAFDAAYALENIGKGGDLSDATVAFDALKAEINKTREAMIMLVDKGSF